MSFEAPGRSGSSSRITPLVALIALVAVGATLSACASRPPRPSERGTAYASYPVGYVQRGVASWYGPGFHGNTTANGERYDMHTFTAAHRTLPMGSLVEVRSLTNGRRVKVRINDRGPFVRGRIIDLSYKAAKALGMTVQGTDSVEIRVIGYRRGPDKVGVLRVQVGSFADLENAQALKAHLQQRYPFVQVVSVQLVEGTRYRVLVGQYVSEDLADEVAVQLARELAADTLVVREDF